MEDIFLLLLVVGAILLVIAIALYGAYLGSLYLIHWGAKQVTAASEVLARHPQWVNEALVAVTLVIIGWLVLLWIRHGWRTMNQLKQDKGFWENQYQTYVKQEKANYQQQLAQASIKRQQDETHCTNLVKQQQALQAQIQAFEPVKAQLTHYRDQNRQLTNQKKQLTRDLKNCRMRLKALQAKVKQYEANLDSSTT